MQQQRLSAYAEAEYDQGDANPLRLAARASTAKSHEFGDAGELYLTDSEAHELRDFLIEALD